MSGYLVRRLMLLVLMLVLLSMAVFVLFSLLPADVARLSCGKACTPEIIEANRIRLGLDKSVIEQYWVFVKGIFAGRTYPEGGGPAALVCAAPCLGYSFRKNATVLQLIGERLPATIWLALGAFVLFMVVGMVTGVLAALRRGRWQDKSIMGVALLGYSLPSFFLGLVVLFFVIIRWKLLPYPSYVSPFENPEQFFKTMLLPWIVLAILYAAFYTRLTRSQMLETLGEDYIRTARAKGLPERTVVGKHALRAGLTPIVTAGGLDLAGLLGGAIITESVFSLPGIGSLAVSAVVDPDLPVLVGITLITAFFVIVANLIVDLLYAAIDPRVRVAA
ncbi:MAG: ABC transporter permease [Actinomycetales bacterium]|nr:ABC transporter permease [Actinomycetales bacterium]